MSAVPVPVHPSPAHEWFALNFVEIQSRTRACVAHLAPERREEAVAEILAAVFKACVNAAKRGALDRVTPYHAVAFAWRQFRNGRRVAGTSSTDVMSEATHLKGRCKVVSLNATAAYDADTRKPLSFSEVLADGRSDSNPAERVRQNLDYKCILRTERVSRNARTTFRMLAADRTQGAGLAIAMKLRLSQGRISQFRAQLADALARHDYLPPPQRPAHPQAVSCG